MESAELGQLENCVIISHTLTFVTTTTFIINSVSFLALILCSNVTIDIDIKPYVVDMN